MKGGRNSIGFGCSGDGEGGPRSVNTAKQKVRVTALRHLLVELLRASDGYEQNIIP